MYKAVFELRTIGNQDAADALIKCFPYQKDSELLKHEIAYALGQLRLESVMPFLIQVMSDEKEAPIVRHEAGEAIAYLNDPKYKKELEKFVDSDVEELKDTCRVALKRMEDEQAKNYNGKQEYGFTLEPAPGFEKQAIEKVIQEKYNKTFENLSKKEISDIVFDFIVDPETHIYTKYKALYFLRDMAWEESIIALGNLLDVNYRKATGALLRHEVCFALGMLADKAKILKDRLEKTIEDQTESSIVRHEAISAYSSALTDISFLKNYLDDESRVVKESAIVAIDMIEYWGEA